MLDIIDLRKLRRIADPWAMPPWLEWSGGSLTYPEVDRALSSDKLLPPPTDQDYSDHYMTRQGQVERIAWLVVNGWEHPIEIDVGSHLGGGWPAITDGNHRTCAAIFARAPFIEASVSGCVSMIESLRWTEALSANSMKVFVTKEDVM